MKKLIVALLIAAMMPACVACSVSVDTDTDLDTGSSVVDVEDTKDDAEDEAEEATEDKAEDKAEEKADDKAEDKEDESSKSDDSAIRADISTDGVDPELVKTLDSYEKFIDDFIVFMTPYKDLDTETADEAVVTEFFTAYMGFLSEQEAVLTSFSEIKVDDLEGRDKEYYEEINASLEQKLKDAGLEEQAGI